MEKVSDNLLIKSANRRFYEILATLHSSSRSTTYKARYVNSDRLLTIKVFPKHSFALFCAFVRLFSIFPTHPNIVTVYCLFIHEGQYWIVMPFPADAAIAATDHNVESLSSIMYSSFPHGMSEETYVKFVLEEILSCIHRVHHQGCLHEKLGFLDQVFVDKASRRVKLDFGISNYENNTEDQQLPVWMTPPDYDPEKPSAKVDIWMFGLLAMELFYGIIHCYDRKEFIKSVSRIRNSYKKSLRSSKKNNTEEFIAKLIGKCFPTTSRRSSTTSSGKLKRPSRLLGEVISLCLDQNPLNRPTAEDLLRHEFFRWKPSDDDDDYISMKLEFFSNPHNYKAKAESNHDDDHKSMAHDHEQHGYEGHAGIRSISHFISKIAGSDHKSMVRNNQVMEPLLQRDCCSAN